MLLIPAIDLRGGRCVRLLQGHFDAETVYASDPLELLDRYLGLGATADPRRGSRRRARRPQANRAAIAPHCRSRTGPARDAGRRRRALPRGRR